MKITIIDTLPISENDYEIIFDTAVGQGKAILSDKPFNTNIGENYSAEFNVLPLFGDIYQSISSEKYQIYHQDKEIFLTGKIEEIDDVLLFFRLNTDCLIMIEFEQPITLPVGSFVSLTVKISDFRVYLH